MIKLFLLLTPTAAADPIQELDFAINDGGMTAETSLQWAWGTPTSGPGATDANDPVWATRLDGNYLNDAADALQLPTINLANAPRVAIALTHWYDMDETGDGDFGWMETRVDGEWIAVDPVYGYPTAGGFSGASDAWQTDWFVFDDLSDASDLRLTFATDALISRSGWYIRHIDIQEGDPIPPRIQDVVPPGDVQDVIGPYPVQATVLDDFQVDEVTLHWTIDGGTSKSTTMDAAGDDVFVGEIPGMDPGTEVNWWIRASDGENTTRWPASSTASFDVYLAAPRNVRAIGTRPDGGYAGAQIPVQWRAPESPYTVSHYTIYLNGIAVGTTAERTGTVPLEDGDQSLVVRAHYTTPAGDFAGEASDPYVFFALVPWVDVLSPDIGWQGDTLRVVVEGENLFLDASSTELVLGEGVDTEDMQIVDVNHAIFTISIAEDAPIGNREAVLQTANSTFETGLQFEVSDGADRPRLVSVKPSRLRQGQHTTLTIGANVTVGPNPTVALGAGIFVEETRVEDGTLFVKVASAANTPLGAHSITVDDGTRVLEGVTIQVKDNLRAPSRVCAVQSRTRSGMAIWLAVVAVTILTRRRSTAEM